MTTVYKSIILLSICTCCFFACQQTAEKTDEAKPSAASAAGAKAFKLTGGSKDSARATFTLSGISVAFSNNNDSLPVQTISIRQGDKRLVNYIRAIDSSEKILPTPYLSVQGKDTLISFSVKKAQQQQDFSFKIRDGKATHSKTTYNTQL
ncbi:hypothetical protein ECE50_017480 [Chitinophaga sp. Mgbs1]|uniref:Lipoprotein n=1 Tax=Chitinophaga solisilvae TaxID=1233460 RepID=A0A9Q5DBZ9_9BACT|nr:hypothetical protein [Chitinophaga solisilvae]